MIALVQVEWFMKVVKEWTLREMDGVKVLSEENILESKVLRKLYFDKYGI